MSSTSSCRPIVVKMLPYRVSQEHVYNGISSLLVAVSGVEARLAKEKFNPLPGLMGPVQKLYLFAQ